MEGIRIIVLFVLVGSEDLSVERALGRMAMQREQRNGRDAWSFVQSSSTVKILRKFYIDPPLDTFLQDGFATKADMLGQIMEDYVRQVEALKDDHRK